MPAGVGVPWFAAISHGYGLRAGMQQLPNKHGSLRTAPSSSVVSIQARPDKNSPRDDGHAENRPGTRRGACGTRHLVPHKSLHAIPGTTQVLPCDAQTPHKSLHAVSGTTQMLPCGAHAPHLNYVRQFFTTRTTRAVHPPPSSMNFRINLYIYAGRWAYEKTAIQHSAGYGPKNTARNRYAVVFYHIKPFVRRPGTT